ncbi:MAG TPA: ABC transporter substrate-binding protein [Methylomirabilota bacterium]|nr:ABC transporter substrate-binding protein [Methylomirabilota bacterium]
MTRAVSSVACAFAVVLTSSLPVGAADTVKLGDLPAISNAGIYIAMEKGYFQQHGITVETERFASTGKMAAPLATGHIDVSMGTPSAGLFNSIAAGMDFKIVADKGQVRPGYDYTPLIVRKDLIDSGKVKTLKDLKGMKVANGAKGFSLDFFLARMMEHAGLDYDALEVVYMSYPDAVKALAGKGVHAVFAPEPWGAQAEQRKIGIRYFRTEQVPSIATFQVAVVIYSGKFIKERPKVARAFLQAYLQGVKVYNDKGLKDPEVASILSKHLKLPVETIEATYPVYLEPSGKPRVQDLEALQVWFHRMGWVREKIGMSQVVDLSFLE